MTGSQNDQEVDAMCNERAMANQKIAQRPVINKINKRTEQDR